MDGMKGAIRYTSSPDATIKQMIAAVKAGTETAAKHWHQHMMPQHFTIAGGKKYGYQKRKGDDEPPRLPVAREANGEIRYSTRQNPAYSWRKRRQKRHNKPLVWSGESEELAKALVRVSSIKRKTGLISGIAAMPLLPKYMYQYRKDQAQPNKADELTRTTPDEVATLKQIVADVARAHMQQATSRPETRKAG